jgi:multidrug efflux pump subunit AcrA (membrane-fusion protein)
MASSKVAQLASGELAKVRQRATEPLVGKVAIKNDHVHVRRHDDEGVDPEVLVAVAESETLRDDPEGRLRNEHRQPFDDRLDDKVNGRVGVDAITLHGQRFDSGRVRPGKDFRAG